MLDWRCRNMWVQERTPDVLVKKSRIGAAARWHESSQQNAGLYQGNKRLLLQRLGSSARSTWLNGPEHGQGQWRVETEEPAFLLQTTQEKNVQVASVMSWHERQFEDSWEVTERAVTWRAQEIWRRRDRLANRVGKEPGNLLPRAHKWHVFHCGPGQGRGKGTREVYSPSLPRRQKDSNSYKLR